MEKKKIHTIFCTLVFMACLSCTPSGEKTCISGVFPHLAHYNSEGECGHGALVVWAGSLWCITYGPHLPFGSSDKLYRISPDGEQTVMPESIGGTSANRMIHPESKQLFIGPYVIDAKGNIRTVSYDAMPGRYTGNARHLTAPDSKIYYGTMEEGFYEVDVKTLDVKTLYTDGNVKGNAMKASLLGAHGKGLYSGQGVLVYSNNGETSTDALKKFNVLSGSLSEWDGKNWKTIRRNQFVEVTGPGGLEGNPNMATDPVWTTGWDHKSLLLGVRDSEQGWSFFRLPKASYSYDGAHGWNTEWPRIRDVGVPGQPYYLMTMHGMFWHFPETFSVSNTAGIRPLSAYLKVIGDFTRWNDRLVFGCDDAAQKEFLNKRKAKVLIEGSGQSNSNLWFTSADQPVGLGPRNASGYVWMNDTLAADAVSEPFLFTGWDIRSAWIKNTGKQATVFSFESDAKGDNKWSVFRREVIASGDSKLISFGDEEQGEWVRVSVDRETEASLVFVYSDKEKRSAVADKMFDGLASVDESESVGGLLYGLGNNRYTLGILSGTDYYEADGQMNITGKDDPEISKFIQNKFSISQQAVQIDESSVLVTDDKERRWRLPLGNDAFTELTEKATLRICREVVTERDLFNCHGTFYELPAENADGYAKIRPVASHNLKINDYASYRGLLVMSGVAKKRKDNPHIFVSDDGKAAVWAGVIDDLWKLGKPVGKGGPWQNSDVVANTFSDPYLIGFYDRRKLKLSHLSSEVVTFIIEADPSGDGDWVKYETFPVKPKETLTHVFPDSFQARWIRLVANKNTKATAWLEYE
ncbi:MAG: hypothetical protein LBS79_07015 [Tannerella sp.]|jgi:hypothetical protein|nr:hypothetical protein [Tannerella sp.]